MGYDKPSDYTKKIRIQIDKSTGYIFFTDKEHPLAYASNGKVYYHRHVVSLKLNRWLKSNEFVHHIDGNRENNHPDNLEITSNAEHARQHAEKQGRVKITAKLCPICGHPFSQKEATQKYCSHECGHLAIRRVKRRPSKKKLAKLIKKHSWVALGRMFGVSDNAIRKWARKYKLIA
jgi:hypothetical protein